jgi:DNA-binding LytR/AlgR family response regulator
MYRIGICDDGENICTEIENTIRAYAQEHEIGMEIDTWNSGEHLCRNLEQGEELDLLFLDIELISLTGIDVGNFIRNGMDNRGMQIVYISSHATYAQQLFKTQPLDFLVKPIADADIRAVLELAIKIIRRRNEKFRYRCGKDYYQIPYGNIMYFYSDGRKINIVTPNGTKNFYGKLKDLSKQLPAAFIPIHQSYVVNKDYIARYTYETVELIDGTLLTISQAHRKQIRESILKED